MATAPEPVPQDTDFTELTKQQAEGLIAELEIDAERLKNDYDVTITGPILVKAGTTETYTVRIRFKTRS